MHALLIAFQQLNPACATAAQAVAANWGNPSIEARRVINALVNGILENCSAPFVLVLDDLHLIVEPAVFVALDHLIERQPPQMRLVIATRHDPPLALPRLRARGQLGEVRLAELMFTRDETETFLNTRLRLNLSPADVRALHARTEGWATGLRLLASSLERIVAPERRAAFIREVARTDRHVFDFLMDEVLKRQEPPLHAFLLETSILPELTAPLCRAVTARDDAAAVLEDLYRRNLFVVALGEDQPLPSAVGGQRSYRYHALFAEFLRECLAQETPDRVAELHRRAARAETDPSRAIHHGLAAEEWELAAQTIEQIGARWLGQGLVDTLAGWIRALPASTRAARPRLTQLLGSCAWEKGDLDAAFALLQDALRGVEALGDDAGQGEVLTDLANCAMLRADVECSARLFDAALAHALAPRSRVQALMGRAGLGFFRNDFARANADFAAATAAMEESADPDVLRLLLIRLNAGYAALPGGKERMERILRQARVHFGDEISPLRVIIEELSAVLHIWRGELAAAIRTGETTLDVKRRLGGGYPFVGVDAATIVVDAYTARGEYAAAAPYIARLFEGVTHTALVEQMRVASLFVIARSYWLQGCWDEARRMYAQICAAENPRELPMDAGFRARLRGMLALSEGRYAEAERALCQAVAIEDREHFSMLFGSSRVLLAYFYVVRHRPDDALAALTPILAESERRGMLSFIVLNGAAAVPVLQLAIERGVHATYAAHLLAVLGVGGEAQPLRVPDTGEMLTAREVEVLRLLVQGASNRAIAEQLNIGEGTVKSHLHHLFGKLGVASRAEAMARSRELRLV